MRNISFCEYGPSGIRAAAHSGPDSMVLNFQDSNFFPEYSGQKYLTPQNSEIKLATFCKIDHLLKLLAFPGDTYFVFASIISLLCLY